MRLVVRCNVGPNQCSSVSGPRQQWQESNIAYITVTKARAIRTRDDETAAESAESATRAAEDFPRIYSGGKGRVGGRRWYVGDL